MILHSFKKQAKELLKTVQLIPLIFNDSFQHSEFLLCARYSKMLEVKITKTLSLYSRSSKSPLCQTPGAWDSWPELASWWVPAEQMKGTMPSGQRQIRTATNEFHVGKE